MRAERPIMKTVLIIADTLNRHFLPNYGDRETIAPNFAYLGEKTMTFDSFYCCSMPCMPARREMHTGRPNFLHRAWSPLEPFDESVIRELKQAGVYTHMVTDHFHYWEEGGYGYLNQYNSFEIVRGQQGDLWKPALGEINAPPTYTRRAGTNNFNHDWINRQAVKSKDDLPTAKVFRHGLDFLDDHHQDDNWLLTLESFSPHEPFFTTQEFLDLYPEDYDDKMMDWPDYGTNELDPKVTAHVVRQYRAMVSMVDYYLGQVLERFDRYNLWEDTALILFTDHGFLLGEKDFMGKNIMSPYEEITHLPFFMHDPRYPAPGRRIKGLGNSLNLAPTLADLFGQTGPRYCVDAPLSELYKRNVTLHEGVMFGVFGAQIGVTDGNYVLFKSPLPEAKGKLYNYTLAPEHMRHYFSQKELGQAELVEADFLSDSAAPWKVLKMPAGEDSRWFDMPDQLFNLKEDPRQQNPVDLPAVKARLEASLKSLFDKYKAPQEIYARFGL